MSRKLAKRWITADEYERMGEAGIFAQDARLELIEGEIYAMSPIGSPHAACVDALTITFNEFLRRRFIVRVQNPIRLDDFSEPQPDVALVRWRDDFYRNAHPTPADVLLVVEVADATVETDRAVKMPLYAKAGVVEVWLVNLPEARVEIFSDLAGGTYQNIKHVERGAEAQSVSIPDLSIGVAQLFG